MDAGAWDERYSASELVWSADANRFVVAELSELPPGRAYDMASGEGRNALWLARRGWRVTAADFSAVALDKARRLAAPESSAVDVEWRQSDVTQDGPEAGEYDLVLLAYLQLPEPARGRALRAAYAGLRPGGTLLVVGHDSSNLTEGYGGPQDAAVLYTGDDVLAALGSPPDLSVERAGRVAREVQTPAGTRTAWDVLVRVRRG